MYCRKYTGTSSHVLCREVYYTVSLFGRVHHWRSTVLSVTKLMLLLGCDCTLTITVSSAHFDIADRQRLTEE